ncbi:MAG TPA: tetratricopeptide repeat protein [Vicinamibacterales bacterium]|nr:tetratricopeptide repeat protein [Vicinamibacterales bacterium]
MSLRAPAPQEWPFRHPLAPSLPLTAVLITIDDLHEAFVNHQTASTRLVTTHATYLMQTWLDAIGARQDVLLVATADPASLTAHAPEVLGKRGPFSDARIVVSHLALGTGTGTGTGTGNDIALLGQAMRQRDPARRLALCVEALSLGRTAPALLAAASTCMEVNDLDAAGRDLDEALSLAPEWAAPHFERGKLWLRLDDMERASSCFREAAERMPGFGSAWANLGATLGELDRPDDALAAFEHALTADPDSHHAVNNLGVVQRELGRLADSERAFQRVIELAPDLAFGHYNLGHTLFLQGRYRAALSAYSEGQRRDPERNPVQASRLAMCRLASGDGPGALAELQRAAAALPADYRRQLLADTHAIAWALLTHRPELAGWAQINEWLTRELAS